MRSFWRGHRLLYRVTGGPTSTAARRILVRNVRDFSFRRYKVINGVDYTFTAGPNLAPTSAPAASARSTSATRLASPQAGRGSVAAC